MQNNIMEIRTDALKLLSMFKRPVPRDAVTIGAWINIFQVMGNNLYEKWTLFDMYFYPQYLGIKY